MVCRERRERREAECEVEGCVGWEAISSRGSQVMVDEAMCCYENGGFGAGCDVEVVGSRRCGRPRYG